MPQFPKDAVEDLETNLDAIQSVSRIARNDAGHPTAAVPSREQVYVLLLLFVPFGRQVRKVVAGDGVLRHAQHFAVDQSVPGEIEGVDFDFGLLPDVDETDVAVRHHRFEYRNCSIAISTSICTSHGHPRSVINR
jgi:hypothetical protein